MFFSDLDFEGLKLFLVLETLGDRFLNLYIGY